MNFLGMITSRARSVGDKAIASEKNKHHHPAMLTHLSATMDCD